jgi:hypothetical protein
VRQVEIRASRIAGLVIEDAEVDDAPTLSQHCPLPRVVFVLVERVRVFPVAVTESAGLVTCAGPVHAAPVTAWY